MSSYSKKISVLVGSTIVLMEQQPWILRGQQARETREAAALQRCNAATLQRAGDFEWIFKMVL
jgi:hypothetical protein